MIKRFSDVVKGDKVFILRPFSKEVLESTVLASFVHPTSLTKKVWVLEIYRVFLQKSITDEHLAKAKEHGTDTTQQVFVDAGQSLVLLTKPTVTAFSTDRQLLETWVNKPGKEVSALIKELEILRAKPLDSI